mmetsp:Transcript_25085/g.71931  ORF Transcript_25085/g.71931 Transcript_25085/m.71931 type:complete len:202 (-) Transcript_25085:38-643(-)
MKTCPCTSFPVEVRPAHEARQVLRAQRQPGVAVAGAAGGNQRPEVPDDGRQVAHVLDDHVCASPVVGSGALHQHLRVGLPLLWRNVPRADVTHDQAYAGIGCRAHTRGAVLHGDAGGGRALHGAGGPEVDVRSRLEAWRVEIRLARVDVQVVGPEEVPQASSVHADRHARLARGRGDDKVHVHGLQGLQHFRNAWARLCSH